MKYRWAPSLGDFEESPEKIWGVEPYNPEGTEDCVFCGLYGLPDFYALWRYKGKKYVWWCGTDILHFKNGYWLEDSEWGIKLDSKPLAEWINKNCESWCENQVEANELMKLGIYAHIAPSFLGDVNKFPISEKKTDRKRYYASVSGDEFEKYGWDKVLTLARNNPETEYHLYGNQKKYPTYPIFGMYAGEPIVPGNLVVHGRIPKEQMNEEIKSMTGCIRLVDFDGFSEVVAKAVLMGQEVISAIEYPFLKAENPREELLKVLNKYPWNNKLQK